MKAATRPQAVRVATRARARHALRSLPSSPMLRALRLSSPSLRLLARPLERRGCATGASAVSTLHRKGMNLLELLSTLPNQGVGAKVYRESWAAKG